MLATCYIQNPGCSISQNILLANAWESRIVDGFLEISDPSFHMLTKHMCIWLIHPNIEALRLPGTYAAKIDENQTPPCMFPSIILLLDHISKI